MPTYTISTYERNIPRDAVILDTNVLVAAFCPRDQHHEDARWFIDEWPDPLFVPVAVLIEAWGMIVGSNNYWQGGIELLTWLGTPGRAELLPQDTTRFDHASDMINSIHVDCVDALISQFADDISRQCGFSRHIRIATYDTGDVTKCRDRYNLQLIVLDMRSFHEY